MNEVLLKLITEKFSTKEMEIYEELQKAFAKDGQEAIHHAIQGALVTGALMYIQSMAEAEALLPKMEGNA